MVETKMRHFIRKISDLEGAVKALSLCQRISHDTETLNLEGEIDIGGLNPFHGSRSYAHVFATETDEFYFDFNEGGIPRKHIRELAPIFSDPERIIFYVNAIFDNCILHFDGIKNLARIADCPALARLDYNRHGKEIWAEHSYLGLDYLAEYYLNKRKNDQLSQYVHDNDLYEKFESGEHVKERFNGREIPRFDLVPFEIAANYGCDDARLTYDIGVRIIRGINGKDQTIPGPKLIDLARNEIRLTSVLIDCKIDGLKVWDEYIDRAMKHESEVIAESKKEIDAHAPGINPNSSKQLGDFLESKGIVVPRNKATLVAMKRAIENEAKAKEFEDIGKLDKANLHRQKAADYRKGNYSLDADSIDKIAEKYKTPFLLSVVKGRQAEKKISTYYSNFKLLADKDRIIHCGLHQETAKTGRFSSSDPNLQNLHKEKWVGNDSDMLIRRSLIANCPDEILGFADYKQQEMIVMLDQAEELDVIKLLLDGVHDDFYLATMAIIKEKSGKELTRQQAKAIALGLAYGQGIKLLANNLGVSLAQAKEIKTAFFASLRALKTFDDGLKSKARVKGFIKNPFGRITYITREQDYTALNAFVQGTSADITKTAMVRIHSEFKKLGVQSKLVLSVHDELIFRLKEKEIKELVPIIKREMSAAYPHKHIPLGVDFEIAERNKYGVSAWGEKIKYGE